MEYSLRDLFKKYYGIEHPDIYTQMIQRRTNISGKYILENILIGGDIKTFMYDGIEYKYDIYKKKEDDTNRLFIKSLNSKSNSLNIDFDNCAQLTFTSKSDEIYVESINGLKGCVKTNLKNIKNIDKQGTMIMYAIIDYAKKYKFKRIKLDDISKIYCKNGKTKLSFSLYIAHTLMYGYSWYCKFNFKYLLESNNQIIKKNKKLMDTLMTKDIAFDVIIKLITNYIITERAIMLFDFTDFINDIDKLTDIYRLNYNNKAYDFFKDFTRECCNLFSMIDVKLAVSLGIELIDTMSKDNNMILDLQ